MVLVDTTIWIDHIRRPDFGLVRLLDEELVLVHPFVVGEIALGRMKNLGLFLARLGKLPEAPVARPAEVLELIKNNDLAGSGIGYVDAHLLASVRLRTDASLWTRDKRLHATAARLSLNARIPI